MARDVVRYGLLSTAQIGLNAHLAASYGSKNSEIVSILVPSRGEGRSDGEKAQHRALVRVV